ncbi:PD-(D/E)XK nuclease family protein [Halorientalis pallida]|uniref:PD-(D/E)XK nuclease family protein n=1 Tax=Halorientalis pallida TaxID=2479928 RepID=UPI001D11538D
MSPGQKEDFTHVRSLIDSLDGELLVQEEACLPLTVDEERVSISGVVDLVHVVPERVEIIDHETYRTRHTQSEYRKQLSVYYHVLSEWFDDRHVTAAIFHTAEGERTAIDPLSIEESRAIVRRTGTR